MPRYDFYCPECEHEFEVTQSIHDELPTLCPSCGCDKVKQHYPTVSSRTASGFVNLERIKTEAKKDSKKIAEGNDRALIDLAGDKPNKLKTG